MPKIIFLKIDNFRSIKEFSWKPSQGMNCLVGGGDSGKTTVLDAIDFCLGARRSAQFSDYDFHKTDTSEPIKILIALGALETSLLSMEAYGDYFCGYDHTNEKFEPEQGHGLETILVLQLKVEKDLEPHWSLLSKRAKAKGVERNLRWDDRQNAAPLRLGDHPDWHLSWRRGALFERLTDEKLALTDGLSDAARKARADFGSSANKELTDSLDVVKKSADELGVPTSGGVNALLDANSVKFGTGAIALHDANNIPLSSLGTGSKRLLVAGLARKVATSASISLVDEFETGLDPLQITRGCIQAPAGCGKTHLIAESLKRCIDEKPILVLTHTNAAVAALRQRLDRGEVPRSNYRLATIDGWAMRMVGMFPMRSAADPAILELANPGTDYPAIKNAVLHLLQGQHIDNLLLANYSRLLVDEYQDCLRTQHSIVCELARVLPTCIFGDVLQGIFDFGDATVDWNTEVLRDFPLVAELATPWRWNQAGAGALGQWLLSVRPTLLSGGQIDLNSAPPELEWVPIAGDQDFDKILAATHGMPKGIESSLIICSSRNRQRQQQIAQKTKGASVVENADLTDLVTFAGRFDFTAANATSDLLREVEVAVELNDGAWKILGEPSVARRSDERNAIIKVMTEAAKPLGPKHISEALGKSENNIKQLLRNMVIAGEVIKQGRGRYVLPET